MPGPAFHLSFIALMALAGLALCFADRGTAPLLAVWILAGVYLGRDLAILAHYNPLLVILWLAGLIAFFIPAVGPRALAALRDFADAHAPAAATIGTAALVARAGMSAPDGWRARAQHWIDRIDHLAATPADGPDERLNKAMLLFLGVFVLAALPAAARACRAQGAHEAAVVLLAGAALSGMAFLHFVRARDRRVFQAVLLGVLLTVPLAAQAMLGGVSAGGALNLWAALAPLLAVVFYGERGSIPWFVGYVVLGLAAGVLGGELLAASRADVLWYAENLLLVTLLYILLRHFVAERGRMRTALAREHALLVSEQAKSERLLLNILPAAIAARLKDDHRVIADGFADVTVLFADIVGFTELAARTTAADLVGLLNDVFSRFDALAERHGAEKIKTIGDAYMACAGLPVERADHAQAIAELALDMRRALADLNAERGLTLDVRIGINSGPVVAGVIGLRKFIYDLWGDTVNVASRMESHGVAGSIQLSAATAALLRDGYRIEPRGRIAVKGKGEVETFFLRSRAAG